MGCAQLDRAVAGQFDTEVAPMAKKAKKPAKPKKAPKKPKK
jgi:hypothetical protein